MYFFQNFSTFLKFLTNVLKRGLTRRVVQTFGYIFGRENTKKATIVNRNALKKLKLWLFRVLF